MRLCQEQRREDPDLGTSPGPGRYSIRTLAIVEMAAWKLIRRRMSGA